MDVREVRYEADGQQMVGTLAVPAGGGPHPAVLIAHEGPGSTTCSGPGPRTSPRSATSASLSTTTAGSALRGAGRHARPPRRPVGRPARTASDRRGRAGRGAGGALGRRQPDRRHRLLLRRDGGPRAGPRRGRPQGDRRVPPRPDDDATGGRLEYHRPRPDVRGRRRPVHPRRAPPGVRGGDARRRRRLAAPPLRRRRPQLHPPRASQAGLPGIAYDPAAAAHSWAAMADLLAAVFAP